MLFLLIKQLIFLFCYVEFTFFIISTSSKAVPIASEQYYYTKNHSYTSNLNRKTKVRSGKNKIPERTEKKHLSELNKQLILPIFLKQTL